MAQLRLLAAIMAPVTLMAGCASGSGDAVPMRYSHATANAAYTANYNGPASYRRGAQGYSGAYWSPHTFARYDGWPAGYRYGDPVGEHACDESDGLYACDTDGDGRADVFGNREDGSFAAPALRVNARGQAFAWAEGCACWRRAPAKDGARQPGDLNLAGEKS